MPTRKNNNMIPPTAIVVRPLDLGNRQVSLPRVSLVRALEHKYRLVDVFLYSETLGDPVVGVGEIVLVDEDGNHLYLSVEGYNGVAYIDDPTPNVDPRELRKTLDG
jgi:hypothetical protein